MPILTATPRLRGAVTARQLLSAAVAATALSACSGGTGATSAPITGPAAQSVALSVSGSGTGSGRVLSSPAGIDCALSAGAVSGTCTARFTAGTVVSLQTQPGATSVFLAFGGDCALATCRTAMEAPRTVTATFVPNFLSVIGNAASVGGGRVVSAPAGIDCVLNGTSPGTGACSSSFPLGTVVTLTQEPVGGAQFQGWSATCTGDPCSVTMNGQRTVDVTYRGTQSPSPSPAPPSGTSTLVVAPSPASRGSGTITSTPAGINCTISDGGTTGACSAAFTTGAIVTLTQQPSGNAVFQGWSGDCVGNPCQLTMSQARAGEVTYRVPPAGIVSISGAGTGTGSVTSSPSGLSCTVTAGVTSGICSASFEAGSTVTLIAGGSNDGSFDGFTGACTGSTCVLPMTTAVTSSVRVGFTAAPQRLTVTPGAGSSGGGVITSVPAGINCVVSGSTSSGACTAWFAANTIVTLQQSSTGNAVFSRWAGDCTAEPCQVAMSQGRTVQPVFLTQGLAVTGGGTGSGVITSVPSGISCAITAGVTGGTCSTTFPPNTVVTLTATASGLSSFTGYTGACTGTTCTVTMVTGITASVTAQFAAPPTLTLSAATGSEGGGTLTSTPSGIACTLSNVAASGSCVAAFALNTSVTVSQAPASGSVFMQWAGACSGSGACTVALSQSRAVQALYRLAVPGSVTVMAGSGNGVGTVSSSPGGVACSINAGVKSGICRAIFPVGSTVSLIATPASGSTFTGFSGSCSGMTCTMTVPENGDIAVTANFAR